VQLTLHNDLSPGFDLDLDSLPQILEENVGLVEEQGLTYFSGFVVKRTLERFHAAKCDTCEKLGDKSQSVKDCHESGLFLYLKKYNDHCSLYSPADKTKEFVKKVSLLASFASKKFITSSNILRTTCALVSKHIHSSIFCSAHIKSKVIGLIVKTIFHYHLKITNDSVRNSQNNSLRKKTKIMNF